MRRSVILLLALAIVLSAQDFRATLNGTVLDPSGAVVPKAQLEVRNTETGEVRKAVTQANGQFSVPLLPPGTYTASAEAPGFKKVLRENIILRAGQAFGIEMTLQVGTVTEQVVVYAETPVLETEKPDRGTVIDTARITELPPVSRNPLMLSVLVAGVSFRGGSNRVFDQSSIDQWSVNGSPSTLSNTFILDGAANKALQGQNYIGYVPEPEALQEVRIQTNSYDAQYGNNGGGVVSMTLKSGTNDLHGSGYYYRKDARWNANNFQNNRTGVKKGPAVTKQPGFQLDGPVFLPKVYDGRNRTFFMVSFEHYYDRVANSRRDSVPQPEFLNGDFSNLVDAQGRKITIYDPGSGRLVGSTWTRDPFANNTIPAGRLDPIAKNILSYFPKPNEPSGHGPSQGYSSGNLFQPAGGKADPTNNFWNFATKVDQNFSSRDRIFGRFGASKRTEHKNTTGLNDAPGEGESYTSRSNRAMVLDWVRTLSPTLIFNTNFSYNRFVQTSSADDNNGFDITTLGFSKTLAGQIFNPFDFGIYQFSGYSQLGWDPRLSISNEWGMTPNVHWIHGGHKVHAGAELRLTQLAVKDQGQQFLLASTTGFTQANYLQSDALSGNSLASFLLGAPGSGQARFPAQTYGTYKYLAPYVQDDWKVTRRLTVNLGLRYDFLVPPTERFDRTTSGFDQKRVNSASSLIDRTKYPEVPTLYGGLLFAGVSGQPRRPINMYWGAIQPRLGVAYRIRDWLVFRGGWGRTYMNFQGNGQIQATGFSFTNTMTTTNDGGRTPIPGLLQNPFPNGTRLPYGAALGDQTFLGSGFTYSNRSFTPAYLNSFSAGFQVRLPMESYLDASYVGTRGRDVETAVGINNISLEARRQCDYFEGATSQAYCNTNVPNPFLGLAPWFGSTLYSSTQIQRNQLLYTFPAWGSGSITENARNDNRSWYNALQMTFETRKKGGLNLIFTFTVSKFITESGYNDVQQGIKNRGLDGGDIPVRSTMGGVYTLPFGKGRKLLTTSNPIASRLVGGWELGWIGQWSAGTPLGFPSGSMLYVKDARLPDVDWGAERVNILKPCVAQWNTNNTITLQPFSVAAGCTDYNFLILPSYAPRQVPGYFPNVRNYSYPTLDLSLSKSTAITERVRVQLRADAYNASNSVGRATAATGTTDTNFGSALKLNSRSDTYRTIQLSLKLVF